MSCNYSENQIKLNLPLIMFSISLDESLPTELEMVMLALRPEVFSVAVTLRIPLTSTSKMTSRTASPARKEVSYLYMTC